jgi:CHASE1-domain containing sensor protein
MPLHQEYPVPIVLTIVKLFISITSTLLALELEQKHTIHWDALKYLLGQEYNILSSIVVTRI